MRCSLSLGSRKRSITHAVTGLASSVHHDQLPAPSPLSADQITQMRQAYAGAKKIRRARGVAMMDGWSVAVFAALAMLFSVFDPLSSAFMLGAGMAVVATLEFIGAARLRRLDLAAPKWLGCNQLLFAAM